MPCPALPPLTQPSPEALPCRTTMPCYACPALPCPAPAEPRGSVLSYNHALPSAPAPAVSRGSSDEGAQLPRRKRNGVDGLPPRLQAVQEFPRSARPSQELLVEQQGSIRRPYHHHLPILWVSYSDLIPAPPTSFTVSTVRRLLTKKWTIEYISPK